MVDVRVTLKALVVLLAAGYVTSPAPAAAQGAMPAPPGEGAPAWPDADAAPRGEPGAAPPEPLPDDPDALLDMLAAEADPVEAGRLAREIEERWSHSGSDAIDLLLVRGRAAIEAGDLPRAVAHLTALTDHAPGFAAGWNARAEAFFLLERPGAALADLEQVLILEPRHFGALAGVGIVLDQLDRPEAALRAFRRAQEVYPAEENVAAAVARLEVQTGGRTL